MDRIGRRVRRHVQRARGVERFARLVVGGGLALVAGLWITALAGQWSPPWVVGAGLVLVGIGGLLGGIWTEIEY